MSIKANQSEVSIVQALIQPIKGKHGDLELLTDLVKDYDLLVLWGHVQQSYLDPSASL